MPAVLLLIGTHPVPLAARVGGGPGDSSLVPGPLSGHDPPSPASVRGSPGCPDLKRATLGWPGAWAGNDQWRRAATPLARTGPPAAGHRDTERRPSLSLRMTTMMMAPWRPARGRLAPEVPRCMILSWLETRRRPVGMSKRRSRLNLKSIPIGHSRRCGSRGLEATLTV